VPDLVLALSVQSWCGAETPARIAWIWPGGAATSADYLSAFKQGMRENGLVEGTHFVIEQRYGEGKYDRFPALIDEVLKRDPAVIMVVTIASVRAAQQATKTVPIVFVSTNDPVGSGLVASLAHPGSNITGLSNQNEDLVPKSKYLALLRETLPRAVHVAVLGNPDNLSNPKMFESVRDAAAGFGITTRLFEATTPDSFDAAFGAIAQYHPDALLVLPDSVFSDWRDRLAAFALRNRIPTFTQSSEMVASGTLMSYGTRRRELYRRSATYVKKILAGVKPGDLPVEQPTNFELVINLKTAKALGLAIPRDLLLRADEVIQ
jgi:putative ABC transport system substrate-binding protein